MAASCASAGAGSTAVHVPSTIGAQCTRDLDFIVARRTAQEGCISIIDRRELEFDARALISIIGRSVHWANSMGLPGSRPTSVDFNPAAGGIILNYEGKATDIISAERLGALLVSYCIRARIPLPKLAEKSVRIQANAVVVAFSTHYSDVPEARQSGA
jgi:hypothetical protein